MEREGTRGRDRWDPPPGPPLLRPPALPDSSYSVRPIPLSVPRIPGLHSFRNHICVLLKSGRPSVLSGYALPKYSRCTSILLESNDEQAEHVPPVRLLV